MKKLLFLFLWVISMSCMGQTDLLWNSLLPNGMDFVSGDGDMIYKINTAPYLTSFADSGIVATAYMGDSLFATNGQYLYVFYRDTLRGRYWLNPSRVGRDQAFIINLFNNDKRKIFIITSVDDTLKVFSWPDVSNPRIVATGIEPLISVSERVISKSIGDTFLVSSSWLAYIEKGSPTGYLRVDTLGYKGQVGSYMSKELNYSGSVRFLRYRDKNFFAFADADSVYLWLWAWSSNDNKDDYRKAVVLPGQGTRDVALFNDRFFLLTDTAVVVYYNFYYTGADANKDVMVVKPESFYEFNPRQFIVTPYGQLLVYPDSPGNVFIIYNLASDPVYYELMNYEYQSSPYPGYINIVEDYNPLFRVSPIVPNSMYTYCQWIDYSINFMGSNSGGYELKYRTVNIPYDIYGTFTYDTIPMDGRGLSAAMPHLYKHNSQDYLIIKGYFKGLPVDFEVYKFNDTVYNLSVEINRSNLNYSYGNWYYRGELIDSSSFITVNKPGKYVYVIENPNTGCVYRDSVIVVFDQYFLVNEMLMPGLNNFYINNSQTPFIGTQLTGAVVSDSLHIRYLLSENIQPSPVYDEYNQYFFWDGAYLGTDTAFTISPQYSGKHLLGLLWKVKKNDLFYSNLFIPTEFYVMTPRMKVILPERRYAVGDTAKFTVSSDTADADILLNDSFSLLAPIDFLNYTGFKTLHQWLNCDANLLDRKIENTDSMKLFLLLATNVMNDLRITIVSPDNKQAVIYDGFNSGQGKYIVGQPYCANYDKSTLDIDYYAAGQVAHEQIDVNLYPVLFTPQSDRELSDTDFVSRSFYDCAMCLDTAKVLKDNYFPVLKADFSAFAGSPVCDNWQIIVEYTGSDPDAVVAVHPYLFLPPGATSYRFLKDSTHWPVSINTVVKMNNYIADTIDPYTLVMKEKGEDSIIFHMHVNIGGTGSYLYEEDFDRLLTLDAGFSIQVKNRSVFYDDQTYSFSPNNDGINDSWNPLQTIGNRYPILLEAPLSSLDVYIVNSDGVVIRRFNMADYPNGWDGLDKNGKQVRGGVYWYIVTYRDQKYYGTVFLMR